MAYSAKLEVRTSRDLLRRFRGRCRAEGIDNAELVRAFMRVYVEHGAHLPEFMAVVSTRMR